MADYELVRTKISVMNHATTDGKETLCGKPTDPDRGLLLRDGTPFLHCAQCERAVGKLK
jgi:hypothetical protein